MLWTSQSGRSWLASCLLAQPALFIAVVIILIIIVPIAFIIFIISIFVIMLFMIAICYFHG